MQRNGSYRFHGTGGQAKKADVENLQHLLSKKANTALFESVDQVDGKY